MLPYHCLLRFIVNEISIAAVIIESVGQIIASYALAARIFINQRHCRWTGGSKSIRPEKNGVTSKSSDGFELAMMPTVRLHMLNDGAFPLAFTAKTIIKSNSKSRDTVFNLVKLGRYLYTILLYTFTLANARMTTNVYCLIVADSQHRSPGTERSDLDNFTVFG